MKHFSRGSLVAISVIIAALIIGLSIILGARIIAKSVKSQEVDILVKTLFEMERMLREKDAAPLKVGAENFKRPEVGSRRVEGVTAGTNPLKGNVNAPVLMVAFSDFQCSYCKKFFQQILPLIEKEYISTGKIKLAYRDYPLGSHALARPAAIAARCAGKQGKYWQMLDKLIAGNSLEKDSLTKYAQELGLNMKLYNECLDKSEIKDAVDSDIKDAKKFGISGTPGFFVNGRFISGTYPFETYKKIIDEELAKLTKGK